MARGAFLRRPRRATLQTGPVLVPFANMTRKSVFRSAVVLILLGLLMVLASLTNPSATVMAAGTLLIGVVMIAIASFAGL
jgi:hypothetical protein